MVGKGGQILSRITRQLLTTMVPFILANAGLRIATEIELRPKENYRQLLSKYIIADIEVFNSTMALWPKWKYEEWDQDN